MKPSWFAIVLAACLVSSAPQRSLAAPLAPACPTGTAPASEKSPDGGTTQFCRTPAGAKTGPLLGYDRDGRLSVSGAYSNDKPHGVWVWYRADGGKREEAEFKDGALDGYHRQWNDTGILVVEEHYENDVEAGKWTRHWDTGAPSVIAEYSERGAVKKETTFDEQGRRLSEGSYRRGEKIGTWVYYWENGNSRLSETYRAAPNSPSALDPTSLKLWDEDGVAVSESFVPLACLPPVRGECAWPMPDVRVAKTFSDPCSTCLDAVFKAPLSRELFNIEEHVVRKLHERGKVIAFRGSTGDQLVVVAIPLRNELDKVDEFYRIRITRDVCRRGMSTCIIRSAIHLVRIPVVNDLRDMGQTQLTDDDLTSYLATYLDGQIRESVELMSRNVSRRGEGGIFR
jgi:antitoxin component YwqK of YwqJK toxin-antitoxin module